MTARGYLQVAPEILHAGPNEPYQSNVDVYSVGCVAYTLLCGYEPFYGQTDAALIAANKAVRKSIYLITLAHGVNLLKLLTCLLWRLPPGLADR